MYSLSSLNSFSANSIIFNDERPLTITFSNVPAANTNIFGTAGSMPISNVGTDITSLISADNVSYNINLGNFPSATLNWASPLPGITQSTVNGSVYTVANIITASDWETIKNPTIFYTPSNSINFGNNYSILSNITYGGNSISWTTYGIVSGPTYKYVKNSITTLWYGADVPSISASDGATYSFQLTLGANVGYIASGTVTSPPANWNYGNLTYSYSGTAAQCSTDLASLKMYPHTDIFSTTTLQYRQARNSVEQINNTVNFVGQIAILPQAPVIGTATGGNARANVAFTPPTNDGGAPIISYTAVSTPSGITATGNASPIMITGLNNSTSYTFRVKATNVVGDSNLSASSNSVTIGVPEAPVITGVTRGNSQATVSFNPAFDNGFTVTNYTVTSNPGAITATGNASPITVTGLTNGTAYTFTMSATNINGTSLVSTASDTVTPATVPNAPLNVVAGPYGANANITFTAPSNGGNAITSYTAVSTPGNITATGVNSPITVTGLTLGTSYTFKVKATNTVGTGAESAASNSMIAGAPGKPIIDRASILGSNSAVIKFNPPADIGTASIDSYTVKSYPGNITVTGNASPITVTGLTTGVDYYFTVTATNSQGVGIESDPSNTIEAGLPLTVEYLIVGAGGAGGEGSQSTWQSIQPGAGGGSGGRVIIGTQTLLQGNYGISVGGRSSAKYTSGDASSFNGIIALGGLPGGRVAVAVAGYNGGTTRHGSGAAGVLSGNALIGGNGIYQGGNGGVGTTNGPIYQGFAGGGGGGGAGGNGGNGSVYVNFENDGSGAGGVGYFSNITGFSYFYAPGGDGGSPNDFNGSSNAPYGGGGGGAGGRKTDNIWDPTWTGGRGREGCVVIKYPNSYRLTVGSAFITTTYTVGDYFTTVITVPFTNPITASGTITFD